MKQRRSLSELLGEPEEQPQPETARDPQHGESDWAKLREGVTVSWLSGALRMDPKTVKKRLGPLKPRRRRNGSDLYDLAEAMSYLVKPKFDIHEYMKTMNPTELPPMLRKEYWDAENKRMTWMERAGELWPTAAVLAVFAEAMKRIKNQMQVWADDVERDAGLTPEQYKSLQGRVDVLRGDIYKVLVEMPKERKSGSALAEGPIDDDESSI